MPGVIAREGSGTAVTGLPSSVSVTEAATGEVAETRLSAAAALLTNRPVTNASPPLTRTSPEVGACTCSPRMSTMET